MDLAMVKMEFSPCQKLNLFSAFLHMYFEKEKEKAECFKKPSRVGTIIRIVLVLS